MEKFDRERLKTLQVAEPKELFLTKTQAYALFYEIPEDTPVYNLKCHPNGRRYDYYFVPDLSLRKAYTFFWAKLSRTMYAHIGESLGYYLSHCGRGDSAEITLEESLLDMFDHETNHALPTHEVEGWEDEMYKVAKKFIDETGFYVQEYGKKGAVEHLMDFARFWLAWEEDENDDVVESKKYGKI